MPYAHYIDVAGVLDPRRLGKQRVEAKQIAMTILDSTRGWQKHPAVNMWRGHVGSLCYYGLEMCNEWIRRGYVDNQAAWFKDHLAQIQEVDSAACLVPRWLLQADVIISHRSNLIRKLPEYYRQFFPHTPDNLPYIWPTP